MKRADLQKWSQAATKLPVAQSSKTKPSIQVVNLAGIRELELKLILYAGDEPRVDHEVAKVSRGIFGIEDDDTLFEGDEDDDAAWESYEDQFETGEHLTDDETMAVLAGLGLDFSDDRGQPLRCTKLMSRVAEAAAKGIKGHLPDQEASRLTQWEDRLAQERDAFLTKKRKGR